MDKRERQLLACIPDVLSYKSLLYIGAANYRQQALNLFIKKEYDCTILYPEFFNKLGWETNMRGEMDIRGSNLLAWWRANAFNLQ